MATATQTIADRIKIYWSPSFERDRHFVVTVVERQSSVRDKGTVYLVSEDAPLPSGRRVFRVRKQGMRADDRYEVHVAADGSTATACTCLCAVYRKNRLECRHRLAVLHLLAEGAF